MAAIKFFLETGGSSLYFNYTDDRAQMPVWREVVKG
jgi:hypothetical protein